MKSLMHQYGELKIIILACTFASFMVVLGIYGLHQYIGGGLMISRLIGDPATQSGVPIYYGLLTKIGINFWISTVAICLFGSMYIYKYGYIKEGAFFLLYAGVFTLIIALDDQFLFHEELLEKNLGVSEMWLFSIYLLMLGFFLMYFKEHLLESEYILLFVSLFGLGSSVAMDVLLPYSDGETFFEDSAKFFGIVFWLTYFSRTAIKEIKVSIKQSSSGV